MKIKSYPSSRRRIIVPSTIYPSLQFIHQIKRGMIYTECEVFTHQHEDNILYVSESLFQSLGMVQSSEHDIYFSRDTIDISMPLGVILPNVNILFHDSPYRSLWIRFVQTASLFGFSLVFFPIDSLWTNTNTVVGFEWKSSNWASVQINIPTFHYLRTSLSISDYKKFRQLRQNNSIIRNAPFLNKWYLFKYLLSQQETSHMVHEITFSPSLQHIERRLENYSIWLKSEHSSDYPDLLIEKKEQAYMVSTRDNSYSFPSFQSLTQHFFPSGITYDVMQLTIPRINKRYHLLLYKSSSLNWDCLILTKEPDPSSIPFKKKLKATAIQLAYLIEKGSNDFLIELGITLCVENERLIWLEDIQLQPSWEEYFTDPIKIKDSLHFFNHLFHTITFQWNERIPST